MLGAAYDGLTFKFKLQMELAIGIGGALAILAISKYSKKKLTTDDPLPKSIKKSSAID